MQEALLDLLRELMAQYVDVAGKQVLSSTPLQELGVDSLTAAELLFALEDRIGVPMAEPPQLLQTVGDVLDYALPYFEAQARSRPH